MTLSFSKEADSLAKMTKDTAILLYKHKQQLFGFPKDTCTTFQVAKTHARMIKFHQKYFTESILYGEVNPE